MASNQFVTCRERWRNSKVSANSFMNAKGRYITILVSSRTRGEQPGDIGPESQTDSLAAVATVIYCSHSTINTLDQSGEGASRGKPPDVISAPVRQSKTTSDCFRSERPLRTSTTQPWLISQCCEFVRITAQIKNKSLETSCVLKSIPTLKFSSEES